MKKTKIEGQIQDCGISSIGGKSDVKAMFIVARTKARLSSVFAEMSGIEPAVTLEVASDDLQAVERALKEGAFNMVVDLTGDEEISTIISATVSTGTCVISGYCSKVWAETIDMVNELKIRKDQSLEVCGKLEKERQTLAKANAELEEKLAEIFFTHEFFKALTRRVNIVQVSELIADGTVGILGTEIACVYLFDRRAGELELKSTHGRPTTDFKNPVKMGEAIIGLTGDREALTEKINPSSEESFLTDESWTGSQVAIPMRIQEETLGVLAMATAKKRKLSAVERKRFEDIANVSALAIQNALFSEELEWLSITDRLTELFNYGHFQGKLREEVRRAERTKHSVSLLMIDIDYFKDYNDGFGHPKGDLVLKKIAQVLKENTRDIDVVSRYGGEEFAVILPEIGKKDAFLVAERIRRAVERTEFVGDKALPVVNKTISLGAACYPDDADTPDGLVEKTDEALYIAKRKGRNRTQVC